MCQVPEGGEAVFFGVGEPAAGSEAGRGGEGGALVEMGTGRDVGRPAVLWLLDGGPGGGGCWGLEECGVVMALVDEDGQVPRGCGPLVCRDTGRDLDVTRT